MSGVTGENQARWEGLNPPYATIVADPPWHYEGFATDPGGRDVDPSRRKPFAQPLPYSSMTLDEIRSLPVRELAASDAWLFLWTTNRYLFDAPSVAAAWGFRVRQTLVWHKTGNPSPFGGTVAPNHAEFLLVASIGTPKVQHRLAGSVIAANKPAFGKTHSMKPPTFADAIERAVSGPYVELFARAPRLGWDSWGHGYEIGAAS